jgi:hypothetical protein
MASPYGYHGWPEMQLMYEHQFWPKAMIKEKMWESLLDYDRIAW